MTNTAQTRVTSVEEFLLAPEDSLRFVEDGGVVRLLREGEPVATLIGAVAGACEIAREAPAAYAVPAEATRPPQAPATALVRLVGGAAVRSVLAVFMQDAELEVHQREVARRADLGLRSAQLALQRLESLGLIESRRDGNRRYYRATRDERFEELRRLLARELGIPEVLARHLAPLAGRIARAFVYGSVAAGTDRIGSDVDVLVVGDVTDDELAEPLAAAQRELGREVDVVTYRRAEFERRLKAKNHFVADVLAGPRIDLIGGPDDA